MPELHNREKVLVQYRLLKDFDDLRRRGIPGIDVRVMEDNIYEWHVTMSPISGHFSGLRIHMVLLLPEDYPRKPPKVELYNFLPHANVFRDFLQHTSLAWAGYWQGSSPARGKYVLCTDLLELKPPPLGPNDSRRHEGWSPSYSVEAVLVQLQCLLFDDYVHADSGHHINTLWDNWYARSGQGRKSRQQVCAELHQAQQDADSFHCRACGYCGRDDSVAFYDAPEGAKSSEEESESEAEECEEQKGTKREHTFVSRKKQKKRELEKLKVDKNPKVDFKQQRLYMEIANSNSALRSGHALRRVPGVFRVRDVVSFRFHGVPDEVYLNGQLCINRDLQIFNYGHEVEYPWRWFDPMLGRFVYRRQQPPEEEEDKKTGKVVWERFVNSQNGGGKLKAEDTPGTEAFVQKREQFYAVGVVESVNVYTCTVNIVIVENDATMGSATAPLTGNWGEWAFNSEQHSSGLKATLYKNIPMEKACIHGYEGFVAPYDHPPPAVYKPVPGHYTADEFLAYDVTKDSPVELLQLLEKGEEVEGLTRQKLAWLPERPLLPKEEAPASELSSVLAGWEVLGDGSSGDGSELELWSLCESDSWDLVSRASQSNRSFEVVSVVSEQSGSLSHSFHVVPSGLSALSSSLGSYDLVASQAAPSDACSVASRISVASERSLLTLRSAALAPENFPADRGHPGSWQLLSVLCKLNVPLRGTVRSLQDFGAFVSLDATPRDLAVQNNKLVSGGRLPKGKSKGKGKGKGKGDGEIKMLQDGLLPCLPYMRPSWPPRSAEEGSNRGCNRDISVMVNGNVFEQMGRQTLGPAEVVVYISEVDVNQRRMKLSLQPRLTFEELRIGGKHEGIVVDTSHLGLFVALSDNLVGLLPRAQLGVGAFAEGPEEDGWYRRSVYKRGDIVTVWVLRKALADANSRRAYKIDLTMDKYSEELSSHFLKSSLKVLDAGASGRQPGAEDPEVSGKTAMQMKFEETFDAEDKFFLIKNNRLIKDAMSQYPELVIDYTTDPPPPPQETTKTKSFDFSLIQGWTVQRITEEHKRLCDKQHKFEEKAQGAKPLSKEEERLLTVLKKKVEQWGNEYYEGVCKKIERHQKFIEDIHRKIKEERDKYPYKSIIDLDKFRELSQRIAEKGYHERCCFVTRLCYKEDVLGVGLEIVPESDTGRKIFKCSFDLLSKEAFKDFGIRSGVWKEKVEFWLPLAIDARHFRRALPYLAECFRQLGDGQVEAATRSYGTQAGSGIKSLRANLRELQRTGQKMVSLDEYKKQKAQPEKEKPKPEAEEKTQPVGLRPAASLTEADVAYGLEVLPKLMNLQTVQLMKGDLHLSTKALEGYMGFHHLLLSILRQYPSLQAQVESKIGTFVRSEAGRMKQSCPNLGEFLCLLAVSKKYTWDDVSAAVLKETLDRNASWALDKYPSLAGFGTSPENRLERTFKASIVSIRLLCFNVWFLRNVVFKRYGAQATSAEILEAEQRGGPGVSCTDMRWAEYEEQKGIPRPEEINMLQEQMRRTLHGNGLNSWSEYFVNLNLQPLKADELSQLLVMSLHDSVRKGYIPLWKMRALQQRNQQEKAPKTNDYLGADMDKYDSMHTTKGGGDRW